MYRVTTAFIIAALAAAVGGWALAASAPAGGVMAQDDDTFALGVGRFEIEGRAPRGLAEFRALYLEGAQLRRGGGRSLTAVPPASVKGEVQARRRTFRLKRAAFDGDRFSFDTVTVGGVSFQFEGSVYNYRTGADQPISPVFKGRLTKLMNGKKVAEGQVTLGHLEPEF